MKKLSKIFMSFILVASFSEIYGAEAVKIAHNHVPPFLFKNGTGASIDYLKSIFAENGIKHELHYMELIRLYAELKANAVDIFALAARNERDKENGIVFAEKPYVILQSGLVVRDDSNLKSISNPGDLKGLVVCTKKEMPHTEFFAKALKDKFIELEEVFGDEPLERCIQMMAQKRKVNAVYSPAVTELVYMGAKLNIPVRRLDFPERGIEGFIAFSSEGAKKYKKMVDAYQEKHQVDDVYKPMLSKYLQAGAGSAQ